MKYIRPINSIAIDALFFFLIMPVYFPEPATKEILPLIWHFIVLVLCFTGYSFIIDVLVYVTNTRDIISENLFTPDAYEKKHFLPNTPPKDQSQ